MLMMRDVILEMIALKLFLKIRKTDALKDDGNELNYLNSNSLLNEIMQIFMLNQNLVMDIELLRLGMIADNGMYSILTVE